MKYSIREYARVHGINAHDLFTMAWKEYFRQIPARSSIEVDVEAYIAAGAVPPYVSAYIKNHPLPRKVYKPYWALA